MRERRFRGQRIDNGEWVEGWLYKRVVHLNDCHQNVVVDAIEVYDGKNPLSVAYYTIDPATVGQYTGLNDKNDKKIFEGDICRDSRGVLFVIEWEKEGRFLGFTIGGERRIAYVGREPKVEVIGNIHDNTELLEGGTGE